MKVQSWNLKLFDPMLMKTVLLDGMFNEDMYQELHMTLLGCIRTFTM